MADDEGNELAVESPRTRRLAWDGCLNVRDLGGYPTPDGHETAWGAIVRADTLSLLTPAGQAALVAYGIRTIIDLRRPDEVAQHPNPFAQAGLRGITYSHVSFIDPALLPADRASLVFATLAAEYAYLLDRFPHQVTTILTTIAHARPGGVVVHCTGGKDRTGLICALLLDTVGVDRAIIAAGVVEVIW